MPHTGGFRNLELPISLKNARRKEVILQQKFWKAGVIIFWYQHVGHVGHVGNVTRARPPCDSRRCLKSVSRMLDEQCVTVHRVQEAVEHGKPHVSRRTARQPIKIARDKVRRLVSRMSFTCKSSSSYWHFQMLHARPRF